LDLQKQRTKFGFVRFYSLLLIIVGLVFYAGYEFASMQNVTLKGQNRLLNKSLGNLTSENEKLQSQYNVLKVELEIAQLANEQAQAGNKDSINREQALKEQVLFYQRVMAPETTQDGFIVQRVEISPTLSERNYSIQMILLQHEDIKAIIKGELDITLHGSENGKPASHNVTALQDSPKTSLSFGFKYFQVLETTITLPANFNPERFDISTDVYKYRKKRGSYSTSVTWQEAFADSE
jgi:hypothetical protein